MFEFKQTNDIAFHEITIIEKEDYSLKEGYYPSPCGGNVPYYLLVPTIKVGIAIIFLHSGHGNKTAFLQEAEELAKDGIVSLLIDAPFVRNTNVIVNEDVQLEKILEVVTSLSIPEQAVLDVRKGIDFILSRKDLEVSSILYVGHSFGATWGGILAGIEDRIKGFILMAGLSDIAKWHLTSNHPLAKLVRDYLPQEKFTLFIEQLKPLAAKEYIKKLMDSKFLFQYALNDDYVSKEQANDYFFEANETKKIIWYETDHEFTNCDKALEDRKKWIKSFFV